MEYCSVSFHTGLTNDQSKKLEGIQTTCLKIILGSEYLNYESALKNCELKTLYDRRESRLLIFSLKCISEKNNAIFPQKCKTNWGRSVQSKLCQDKQVFQEYYTPGPKEVK